jgi:propionyl-CoA carboxylase alpha chain
LSRALFGIDGGNVDGVVGSSSGIGIGSGGSRHRYFHHSSVVYPLRRTSSPTDYSSSFFLASSSSSSSIAPFSTSSTSSSSSSVSLPPPLRKILIANRGEIAIRIIKSAREHGIKTVAIYSSADARSPHVTLADEAVCLGPNPASSASYLDIDKVCEAVRMTHSEGVHPGYGFLSENCKFAERVESIVLDNSESSEKRKVKFIGPSTHAIQSLGDKIQSKLIAASANVSTVPGYNGVVTSPSHALEIAHDIGYPVMIKASAGGGGKGMRICYTDEEVNEGYRLSKAESASFFGDDRLLVEKYVEDPHHIEIQVLAGTNPANGQLDILCFAERECSIQRRNQKVIEESPSPHLHPSTRREMIRQVKSLVRAVGYESAGTVEFLVDAHQNFYFLEMNTRLQVEHPVTEMISGSGYPTGKYVDLVYGMFEVAAGRGIPREYLDMVEDNGENDEGANVRYTGHAIEARVYAEDPYRGFLPSTGPLVKYVEPPSLIHVENDASISDGSSSASSLCNIRIDSGAIPGAIITTHYDPIISKIISYSPISRQHAIHGLGMALDQYIMRGVQHNIPFVRDVLRNDDFVKGITPTGFIGQHYPEGFHGAVLSDREKSELVVIMREIDRRRKAAHARDGGGVGEDDVVVCLGGMFGDAYLVRSAPGNSTAGGSISASVTKLPKRVDDGDDEKKEEDVNVVDSQFVELSAFEYKTSSALAIVEIAGESRALQVRTILLLCQISFQ